MTAIHPQTNPNLDATALADLLTQEPLTLIDVREPVEFAADHLHGAINLPLSRLQPAQLKELDHQKIVLYCRSGQRSGRALDKLQSAGIACYQLEGGVQAWAAAGYPLQKNAQAPISLFRQVQIVAGSLVLLGTVAGVLISPWFLCLSGFVGVGLVFAGVTNTCALGMLLAKLPYNQKSQQTWGES